MKFLIDIKDQILNFVWHTSTKNLVKWKKTAINALRIAHLVIRDVLQGQLTLQSMGLVYTTLLSLVPLLAVSFSVLKGFGVHNQIEPLLNNLLQPLGEKGLEISQNIIGFVDNVKVGVLGSLGLVLLLYTVISLMQKIEYTFNSTWNVTQTRSFAQRFSDYLSVVLIGPVLVFTALGMTAAVKNYSVVQQLLQIEVVGTLVHLVSGFIPYALVILAFTIIYIFVPNTKVKFTSALVGGVVAGVLWQTAGWVLTAFVANSTKYTAIYSVFASLIIFMIWLYVSWLILLIGCSIAFYFQHPEYRQLHSRNIVLSSRMKEMAAIKIVILITQNYYQKLPAWTLDGLAKKLKLGVNACNDVICNLVNGKVLVSTSDDPIRYLPAKAPEVLHMEEIIKIMRTAEESPVLNTASLSSLQKAEDFYKQYEDAMYESIKGTTLRDFIDISVDNSIENKDKTHETLKSA